LGGVGSDDDNLFCRKNKEEENEEGPSLIPPPESGNSRDWLKYINRIDSYLVKLQEAACKDPKYFEKNSEIIFRLM
jgi:hypothetical protein